MKNFILAVILLLGFASNGNAHENFTPASEEEFFRHVMEIDIHELINADVSEEQRLEAFLPFVKRNLDVEPLLRLTLRRDWNRATEEERQILIDMMYQRAAKLYLKHFEKIRDGAIVITRVDTSNRRSTEITVDVILKTMTQRGISFFIKKLPDGSYKIFDISFSGIRLALNLSSTYRQALREAKRGRDISATEALIEVIQKEISDLA